MIRYPLSGDTGPESDSPVIVGALTSERPQSNLDRHLNYDERRGVVRIYRALPSVLTFSDGKWIRRSEQCKL